MLAKLLSKDLRPHVYNYLFRLLYLLFSFLTIRALLQVLGTERFGIWQVFLVAIEYIALANFGLSNSLRNATAQNISHNDQHSLNKNISNVILLLVLLLIGLLPIGLLLISGIDPQFLFKETTITTSEIKSSFQALYVFSCFNLLLVLGNMLAFSIQRSQLNSIVQFLQVFLFYAALQVHAYVQAEPAELATIVTYFVVSQLVTSVPLIIFLFRKIRFRFIWNANFIKESYSLVKIGFGFFLLQAVSMVLVNFDAILVSSTIGVRAMATYAIINKVFNVIISLYAISIIPLWSQATHLRAQNDIQALVGVTQKYFRGSALVAVVVAIVIVFFNPIMKLLFNVGADVSFLLLLIFGLFVFLNYFAAVVINVLNGLSIIRSQLLSLSLSVIVVCAVLVIGKLLNYMSLELIVTAKVLGSFTLFFTSYKNLNFSFRKLQPAF
ncbi:oligosaccharide flippase family protein [Aridibaculum aurantiacum]|uniref:oligosaccharide flippase family protein n=1 Tax=Aridibaculum aurantiacum TaxID=2810307 RepID=UPI001A97A81D|nr:oligosaccharide flippase family protein [Aridibaculum aurantiacum]